MAGGLVFLWMVWGVAIIVYIRHPPTAVNSVFLLVASVASGTLSLIYSGRKTMFNKKKKGREPHDAQGTALSETIMENDIHPTPCALLSGSQREIPAGHEHDVQYPPTPVNRCTVVAQGGHFRGEMVVTGDVHIYGHVEGLIRVTEGIVRIMKTGRVEGEVFAPFMTLDGEVLGLCESPRLDILEHGHMQGIIRTHALSIAPGGRFLGQSDAYLTPAEGEHLDELSLARQERKPSPEIADQQESPQQRVASLSLATHNVNDQRDATPSKSP